MLSNRARHSSKPATTQLNVAIIALSDTWIKSLWKALVTKNLKLQFQRLRSWTARTSEEVSLDPITVIRAKIKIRRMLTKIRSAVANKVLKSRRAIQSWGHLSWIESLKRPLMAVLSGVILRSWSKCSRRATHIRRKALLVFHKMIRRVWRWHWTPRMWFIALPVKGDKTWCTIARIPKTKLRQAWGGRRHEPSLRWAAQKSTLKLERQTLNWTCRVLALPRQN